jgi:DNA modification methylase
MIKPYYEEPGITIYHGDCRDILPHLELVDLVLTDPPYGVKYDGGTLVREKLRGDNSPALYTSCLKLIREKCKLDCALYIFYADGDGTVLKAVLEAGFEIRNTLIWNKNLAQFGALSAQYKQKHEPFLYCHIKGKSPRWFGPTNETTVWDCDRALCNEFHPTQKPVNLFKRAIMNSSNMGDIVLDPFMGSGTTLRAAKDLGRKAIGIEIEEKYCEIAVRRLKQEVFPFTKEAENE